MASSSENFMNSNFAFMETWFPSFLSPQSADWFVAESSPSLQQISEENKFPESIFDVEGGISPNAQNIMGLMNTLENLSVINYSQTILPIPQAIGDSSFCPLPIYDQTAYLESAFNVDAHAQWYIGTQNCMNGMHTLSSVFHQPQMISSILVQDNHVLEQENGVHLVNVDNQMTHAIDHGQKKRKRGANQIEGKKTYPSKGRWTEDEDRCLVELVERYGENSWSRIAASMGSRAGKQCRERWYNHLHPEIKMGPWTKEEEVNLVELHKEHGNKWTLLSKFLAGRPENMIKNHWNATKRKKKRGCSANTVLADYITLATRPAASWKKNQNQVEDNESSYVSDRPVPVIDQVIVHDIQSTTSLESVNHDEASDDVSWLLDSEGYSEFDNNLDALLAEIEANSNGGG
ncbi:hypothetical protein Dimus_000295 [Dionaea muscipula]